MNGWFTRFILVSSLREPRIHRYNIEQEWLLANGDGEGQGEGLGVGPAIIDQILALHRRCAAFREDRRRHRTIPILPSSHDQERVSGRVEREVGGRDEILRKRRKHHYRLLHRRKRCAGARCKVGARFPGDTREKGIVVGWESLGELATNTTGYV